jgi:hypothetical protein
MSLKNTLTSPNFQNGFFRGFFAPYYFIMSFFEKKFEPVKKEEDVPDFKQALQNEKEKIVIIASNLIEALNNARYEHHYIKLLVKRLLEALAEDDWFAMKSLMMKINAAIPSLDLEGETVEVRQQFRKSIMAIGFFQRANPPMTFSIRPRKNAQMIAMEDVIAFHADALEPYKHLVDNYEKTR